MFRSLWFRLVGTLAVVIAVALVAITLSASLITARQFGLYTVRGGQVWANQLVPLLANHYREDGGWENAQAMLVNPWQGATVSGDQSHRFGPMGPMMGPGSRMQQMEADLDMWSVMNLHLLLVDADGIVVGDTQKALLGQTIPEEVLAQGTPIVSGGVQVGSLVVLANEARTTVARPDNFLISTARSVLIAALAAGLVGIVLGTVLFRRITLPLNELQKAARTVESGQLAARVPVKSRDEIGMVAEAFNQMTARLERQQRLRKQMVGDIAHELRTPLSVMQGTIEAMLDGVLKPNKTELKSLHNEIRRLTLIVEDLRTLSLADEGQLRLEKIEVNPAALVANVTRAMQRMANNRGINLTADVVGPLPLLLADGDRLAEVLTNLVGNALRYSPDGGHVTVSARHHGEHVILAVADDGPGIPEEDQPFVFERFWRGDKSRSRGSGGSGIGLAIVRQLVELHGGKVSIESKVGEGTTFRVSLPLDGGSAKGKDS